MANKISTLFKKLENLERDFQKLKIETFFALPEKRQRFIYPEEALRKAIRTLRKTIWQERYARKI